MALRGTLKDFALPDIFQLIGMQRKTGLLTLESERETVTVLFENGMVVHADSSVRRLDDLLGNVLVRHGKLKKQSLVEALAKQQVSMQRLGYILTQQGYIEKEDLREALSEQVQQIVFRIFRWKAGQYHFDPSTSVDYDRSLVAPVSTDHILMEGIRRVDEWPIIEKRIPSLDVVFRPLVPFQQIQVSEEGSDASGSLESAFDEPAGERRRSEGGDGVVLSVQEARIYRLLDGKRSVGAIVELTGLSDFDVCRAIFDFLDRNLVAQTRDSEASPAAPAVRKKAPAGSAMGNALFAAVLVLAAGGLVFSGTAVSRVPGLTELAPAAWTSYRRAVSVARLQRVDRALRAYYLVQGEYPGSLDDLVNARPAFLAAEDLRDGEGRLFAYERTPERVQLEALTEAGEPYLIQVYHLTPAATVGMAVSSSR